MKHALRYIRQVALTEVGAVGQQKFCNAKVLVIGAGGLGCPVLQMLAASGIGTLGIVDGDIVEETNLHRQLLYTSDDCGANKVDVAKNAIFKINAAIKTVIYPEFINESNIAAIVNDYGIIVDCTDNIVTRYLTNDIAVFTGKTMVYASIHKFEGQVSVFNYQNGPTYRCLFPEKESAVVPNCVTSGVLGVLPNTLGMLQATEVLKIILGTGEILSGRLLIYDALQMAFSEVEFEKSRLQTEISFKNGSALNATATQNRNLDKKEFLEKCNDSDYIIIDLREHHEEPKIKNSAIVKVPFAEIMDYQSKLKKTQPIVLFCQSGIRSKKALHLFVNEGFTNVYHLQNGVHTLQLSAPNLIWKKNL